MYSPVNVNVYLAAFAGAMAGLRVAGRGVLPASASDDAGAAAVAGAYAQQFDTQYAIYSPVATTLDVQQILTVSLAAFESRSPASLVPTDYSQLCISLVASVQAGDTYVGGQSIPVVPANSSSLFVTYKPGGVAAPGVYVTEATLSAAVAGQVGPTIFFDFSLVGGVHFFTTVGNLDLGIDGTWTDFGQGSSLGFNAGTTLAHPPRVLQSVIAVAASQAAPLSVYTSGNHDLFIEGKSLVQQFGTNQGICFQTQGTSTLAVYIRDFARISTNGSATVGVFDALGVGSNIGFIVGATSGLGPFALTPNPSGSGGKGTASINIVGDVTFYSTVLLPLMIVQGGILNDASGTAIGLVPAGTSTGLIFQTGTFWSSTGSASWTPVTPLKGRTTLVAGESPVVAVASMSATTRIVLGRAAVNASTTLGDLAALETDRVNGTPGSFRISALQPGTPGSLQAGDVSDVDFMLCN